MDTVSLANESVPQLVKNLPANAGDVKDTGSITGLRRFLGAGNSKPMPVFLLGKSNGQRSLVGYSPWGLKESDTTEHAHILLSIFKTAVFAPSHGVSRSAYKPFKSRFSVCYNPLSTIGFQPHLSHAGLKS